MIGTLDGVLRHPGRVEVDSSAGGGRWVGDRVVVVRERQHAERALLLADEVAVAGAAQVDGLRAAGRRCREQALRWRSLAGTDLDRPRLAAATSALPAAVSFRLTMRLPRGRDPPWSGERAPGRRRSSRWPAPSAPAGASPAAGRAVPVSGSSFCVRPQDGRALRAPARRWPAPATGEDEHDARPRGPRPMHHCQLRDPSHLHLSSPETLDGTDPTDAAESRRATRTGDLIFTRDVLYQLSYPGPCWYARDCKVPAHDRAATSHRAPRPRPADHAEPPGRPERGQPGDGRGHGRRPRRARLDRRAQRRGDRRRGQGLQLGDGPEGVRDRRAALGRRTAASPASCRSPPTSR